jgi:quercetin dioxygenase-like cupin family protein
MKSRQFLSAAAFLLVPHVILAQDVMQYGVKHIKVLAEDASVRVLRYSPHQGDKTPVHSHPASVVYVVKGGRVRTILPDGSVQEVTLKTGEALIRPPITHSDEALEDVELILVEMKVQAPAAAGAAQSPEQAILDFATQYTAGWCSHDPAQVALFFSPEGSLTINDGPPSVGRAQIAAAAKSFMTAFPDLAVRMDSVSLNGRNAVYRWTLTGTNTGPGGTGKPVRISGYEEWSLGSDGLVERSLGHFDRADYDRQISR